MNLDDQMILLLAYAALFAGVVMVVVGLPVAQSSSVASGLVASQRKEIEDALDDLGMLDYTPSQFLLYLAGFAVMVGMVTCLASGNPVTSIFLAVAAAFSYKLLFIYLREKRNKEFEERFPMALDQLVSAARAGLTLSQALEEVSNYAPWPVSDEFKRIVREQKLGTDISTALINAKNRVGSHTLGLTVSALLINIQQGGNLPDAMDKISRSMKEIWRLEQKLFTASAEARKGAMVISVMPMVIFIMVLFMQPDMLDTLTGSLMGYGVLAISAALYVTGIAWMIKIIRVDI